VDWSLPVCFFNSLALALGLGLAGALLVLGLKPAALPYESLALGRTVAEASSLPRHENLVYSAPASQAFDARSWGYDLLAFLLVRNFGLSALRLGDALAVGLGLLGLAAAFFRRGARPFSSALCLVWVAWATLPDLAPGPPVWSWALAGLCLGLLEGSFWEAFFNRWVWLAPLVVLWVNLRASAWVLAPALALWLFLDGREADALRPQQPRLAKLAFFLPVAGPALPASPGLALAADESKSLGPFAAESGGLHRASACLAAAGHGVLEPGGLVLDRQRTLQPGP